MQNQPTKSIALSFLFLLLSLGVTQSQSITGNIEIYLNDYIDDIPGNSGDDFNPPGTAELINWENILEELLLNNIENARSMAAEVNYQIVDFTDDEVLIGQEYFVLEEKMPRQNYWGTFVFNKNACRPELILQAPHPRYDTNTGSEAVFCFTRLSARALFLSGTHRCNHDTLSDCDGSTSTCSSSSQPYSISDMAHSVKTCFQKTTEVLFNKEENTVFIQLHGFAKQSTDPYLIFSYGSREDVTPDLISELNNELQIVDNVLTAKMAHIDLSWTRLIGFTNTQGRFINGSVDACFDDDVVSNGRFIHIEQEKSRLRENATGWNKMKVALEKVFTCNPAADDTPSPIEPSVNIFPNPTEAYLNVEGEGVLSVQLVDAFGRTVLVEKVQNSNIGLNVSLLSEGIYSLAIKFKNALLIKRIMVL